MTLTRIRFAAGTALAVILASLPSVAADPCTANVPRALVLSGGGVKGAFEAGAIVHLTVDRGCDFTEVSGISVGGLNAAFLAQAGRDPDPAASRKAMAQQAEDLAELWQSLRGPRDILKPRRFGALRVFVGRGDSLNDFAPLRRLVDSRISIERLQRGRTARVGVVSLPDGRYREVVSNPAGRPENFLDYIYAGAVLPVIGRLPRIREGESMQRYGDSSIRHVTPIVSYFPVCPVATGNAAGGAKKCDEERVPPHEPVEQLFVIVTSPYVPGEARLPLPDDCCPEKGFMDRGKKLAPLVISTFNDTVYRADLDFALFANQELEWRRQQSQSGQSGVRMADTQGPAEQRGGQGLQLVGSRPYLMALVAPEKETATFGSLFDFSPKTIQEQMHDGCIAADKMMTERFGLPSMTDSCERRFPTGNSTLLAAREAQ